MTIIANKVNIKILENAGKVHPITKSDLGKVKEMGHMGEHKIKQINSYIMNDHKHDKCISVSDLSVIAP